MDTIGEESSLTDDGTGDGARALDYVLSELLRAPPMSEIRIALDAHGITDIGELLSLTPEVVQEAINKDRPFFINYAIIAHRSDLIPVP